MKKKIFVVMILVCIFLMSAGAKKYYDFGNGYYGEARSECLGTEPPLNAYEIADFRRANVNPFGHFSGRCYKLSNEENFLVGSALCEYNLKTNEVYSVALTKDYVTTLLLIVVIKDNGKSYKWYDIGYYYKY